MNSDWTIIKSVEGGEIQAKDDGDRVRVSYPDDVPEAIIREALADKDIAVGDVVFEAGESEGETAAFFSKA